MCSSTCGSSVWEITRPQMYLLAPCRPDWHYQPALLWVTTLNVTRRSSSTNCHPIHTGSWHPPMLSLYRFQAVQTSIFTCSLSWFYLIHRQSISGTWAPSKVECDTPWSVSDYVTVSDITFNTKANSWTLITSYRVSNEQNIQNTATKGQSQRMVGLLCLAVGAIQHAPLRQSMEIVLIQQITGRE